MASSIVLDLITPRRALLSVSDKTGLVEFARVLAGLGVELISTGGTARALREAGLRVLNVEDITGFPEMMDGRVKTLHPMIHGGILARRAEPEHLEAMARHGIRPIDLVCISLYPFERTIASAGVTRDEAIEQIDVGGPSMIRGAAKNHESVAVVVSPEQYAGLALELQSTGGSISLATRQRLAAEAFERTASYDRAIASYLAGERASGGDFPERWRLELRKTSDLRYGENPHQSAAVYADPAYAGPSVVGAEQLHGKELSYNNINDASAALALVIELGARGEPSAAVIKHANPCGAASASSAAGAVRLAIEGDPVAAYGGILALSCACDEAAAAIIAQTDSFFEVVLAPGFDEGALARLRARSINLRLLKYSGTRDAAQRLAYKSIPGGALAQTPDIEAIDPASWRLAAGPAIDPSRLRAAAHVWTVAKHLSSNAIAIGGETSGGTALFGAGAGQMDRVASCRIAIEKAGGRAAGAIAASDAFFPFADGPLLLIEAGVKVLVHPGGSKRDQETFDLCNQRGVTCLLTGFRHFRH